MHYIYLDITRWAAGLITRLYIRHGKLLKWSTKVKEWEAPVAVWFGEQKTSRTSQDITDSVVGVIQALNCVDWIFTSFV